MDIEKHTGLAKPHLMSSWRFKIIEATGREKKFHARQKLRTLSSVLVRPIVKTPAQTPYGGAINYYLYSRIDSFAALDLHSMSLGNLSPASLMTAV